MKYKIYYEKIIGVFNELGITIDPNPNKDINLSEYIIDLEMLDRIINKLEERFGMVFPDPFRRIETFYSLSNVAEIIHLSKYYV